MDISIKLYNEQCTCDLLKLTYCYSTPRIVIDDYKYIGIFKVVN